MAQTLEQFGQTIKAKHPEYNDLSDVDVATKVLAKYPQYHDMVSEDPTSSASQGSLFGQGLTNVEQKAQNAYGKDSLAYKATLPARAVLRTASTVGDFLTGATQKFADTMGGAMASGGNADLYSQALQKSTELHDNLIKAIQTNKASGKDTSRLEAILKQNIQNTPKLSDFTGEVINKTNPQIAGQALGVAGDILPFGEYGEGQLFGKTGQLAKLSPEVQAVGEKALPKVKEVLKNTVIKTGIGSAIGEGYDVSQNLQEGKTGTDALTGGYGKYIGAAAPIFGGAYGLAKIGGRAVSPSFVNSLIGANPEFNKAVKFGKNPGLTAVKYGITANSLPEFEEKLSTTKDEVGKIIGNNYNLPENLAKREDYSDIFSPLDSAIAKANKSPETNKALISRLEAAKSDLTKQGTRDFTNSNPAEMFDLKQQLKDIMKFTGAPSDDIGVNGALNGVYGKLVGKVNKAIPEMAPLNEDYGGLLSAELSTRTKEQRGIGKSMISWPSKIGAYGGLAAGGLASVLTGGVSLVPALSALGGAGLEKVLSSAAAKTRIANWLGGATSQEIQSVLRNKTIEEQNGIIKTFQDLLAKQKSDKAVKEFNDKIQATIDSLGKDKLLPAPDPNVIRLPGQTQVSIPPYSPNEIGRVGGMEQRNPPPKNQYPSGTPLFPENQSLGKGPSASQRSKMNNPIPKKKLKDAYK